MISTVLLVQQSNRCLWYCVLPGTYARTTVLPGTVGVCPSRDVTLADRTNSPVEINRRTGYMVLYTWYTNCSNNPFKKMWVDVKTTTAVEGVVYVAIGRNWTAHMHKETASLLVETMYVWGGESATGG